MRSICIGLVVLACVLPVAATGQKPATGSKDLKIMSIDAEGGAAVLLVTPEGKSLLIDTGFPPRGPRPAAPGAAAPPPPDPNAPPPLSTADRIVAAAKTLGVTKIDYLLMTHYHVDHVGGVPLLLEKMQVGAFIDHGPNAELLAPDAPPRMVNNAPQLYYPKWEAAIAGHEHTTVKVGDKLDIGSLHLQIVTSAGKVLTSPLPGAGQANGACANVPAKEENGGVENEQSVGMVMTFGNTKILYLGDLTWNKEIELLCPVNRVGKVDLYFVSGHGMDLSSSPPTVALDPLVAIMQNGPTKGGDEAVIKTVNSYPSLQGFWRTHYSRRYPDSNGDPNFIANMDGVPDAGNGILVDITPSGAMTVTNTRNGFSKTVKARAAK
jgi:competence protein ComEC